MKNINIPVTNEQPIVLSGSVPNGGGGDDRQILFTPASYVGENFVDTIGLTPDTRFDVNVPENYTRFMTRFTDNNWIKTIRFNNVEFPNDYERNEAFFESNGIENYIFGNGLTILPSYLILRGSAQISIKIYLTKSLAEIHSNCIQTQGRPYDIYYEGTEAEWNNITGVENIDSLATLHFEASPTDIG